MVTFDKEYLRNYWVTFFLLFPHLKPDYFEYNMPVIETIINLWRVLSFVLILMIITLSLKGDATRFSLSKVTVCIITSEIYIVLITIYNNTDIRQSIVHALSTLSIILIYEYCSNEYKCISFFSACLFCFEIVVYINLITVLLFPEGVYNTFVINALHNMNYFLGYYNNFTVYFVPGLVVAFLYKDLSHKSFRAYLFYTVVMITSFMVWSGGLITVLLAMSIVYLFFAKKTTIFNYYNYWLIQIVFYVLVVKLKIYTWLEYLIGGALGKWASLVGRLDMYKVVIDRIHEKILFGHGQTSAVDMVRLIGFSRGVHAHNLLLHIFFTGGTLYFVLFITIIMLAGKSLIINGNSGLVIIISIGFLGWSVHSTVEPFLSPLLMSMFVLAANYERWEVGQGIIKEYSIENN